MSTDVVGAEAPQVKVTFSSVLQVQAQVNSVLSTAN